ncbi:hypothetical protein [Sphingomonas hengshuiensis]|uniref:DUF4136 domain-containing protein n=1 Tax=Sphingomonas hengshuiensis TaxID=1609977 RepID=A0A7U5HVL7_9SPHN|nr:hypothetical protein [Sphingomonas hengshuiensis]AJP74462.1 hypothetical protein TS85_11790 [Sphingomonas hengshuiensis]
MLRYFMSAIGGLLLCAAPAQAQFGAEASASKAGFAFPASGDVRIVVFRPDVAVGSQSTAGLNEPNAEWTATAREHLGTALIKSQQASANTIVAMPDLEGEQGQVLADYRALFKTVANTVVYGRLFAGNRLPTKRADFRWTLGEGASRLREIGGADYGLFFYTYDSYGSAGRKTAQIFAAMLGVGLTAGVHIGYAGLVDLRTGELVWINADLKMGGDVRDPDGAAKRVSQLMEDFPRRALPAVAQ